MTGDAGHWGLAPGHAAPARPAQPRPAVTGSAPPARLVAVCDLRSQDTDRASFDVTELLVLADGQRVVLHEGERGWTSHVVGQLPRPVWTREGVVRSALTVVLPDGDDDPEPHPWAWLAELATAAGVPVTADDLRGLPYGVELSERLAAWLDDAG